MKFSWFRGFRRGGLVNGPTYRASSETPAILREGEYQLVPAEDLEAGDLVYINPADGKVYKCAGQTRCFRIPPNAVIEGGILNIPQSEWPL
jgi:hypothetical protein